jgi:drug/metabolite transporter (DMT)-like permease
LVLLLGLSLVVVAGTIWLVEQGTLPCFDLYYQSLWAAARVAGAVSGALPIFFFVPAFLFIVEEKAPPLKGAGILIGFIGVVIMACPSGAKLTSTNLESVAYIGY